MPGPYARSIKLLHVDCPMGTVPLSGGWELVRPTRHVLPVVLSSLPGTGTRNVELSNRSNRSFAVTLHAVCATVT